MAKVVFISGASSGLGAALAAVYARRGDAVLLAARRRERIEAAAAAFRAEGGQTLAVTCDVTDRQQVQSAVHQAEDAFGAVDLMIANAGIALRMRAETFDAPGLDRLFQVNVLGAAYCFEAVLPSMLERNEGHLVGISSLAGYRGLPGAAAYCASKAALTSLLQSFRVDLIGTEVDVTTICPGFVKTELTAGQKRRRPFQLEADDAARRMQRAIDRKKTEYAFPWPMALLTRTMRIMPNALFDPLAARLGR
jgi:short-subunit dehydrogenase